MALIYGNVYEKGQSIGVAGSQEFSGRGTKYFDVPADVHSVTATVLGCGSGGESGYYIAYASQVGVGPGQQRGPSAGTSGGVVGIARVSTSERLVRVSGSGPGTTSRDSAVNPIFNSPANQYNVPPLSCALGTGGAPGHSPGMPAYRNVSYAGRIYGAAGKVETHVIGVTPGERLRIAIGSGGYPGDLDNTTVLCAGGYGGDGYVRFDWVTQPQGDPMEEEDRYMIMPDMSKKETTPVISANNGVWICNRMGYLQCEVSAEMTTSQWSAGMDIFKDGIAYESRRSAGNFFMHKIIIPVDIGEEIKITLSASTSTATSVNAYFIPLKIREASTPLSRSMFVPDYANEGPANLLVNGSWTADRNGFVRFVLWGNIDSWDSGNVSASINGKRVMGGTTESNASVVPVSIGDIVTVEAGGGWNTGSPQAFFIPAKEVPL